MDFWCHASALFAVSWPRRTCDRLAPSWQTRVFGLRRLRAQRDAKTAHWSRDGLGLTEPHAESHMTWRARSAAEPWPAYSQKR